MNKNIKKIYLQINKIIPLLAFQIIRNEISLIISIQHFNFVFNVLKNHINLQYKLLTSISGVDLLKNEYRFLVVYDLLSLVFNNRIRIKAYCNEYTSIPSLTPLYINSNWWEREIWDLYGIYFENHPDLRRILNDYGFEGYPLRKDFPLSGFFELRYSLTKKTILSEPVNLTQNYRLFESQNQW